MKLDFYNIAILDIAKWLEYIEQYFIINSGMDLFNTRIYNNPFYVDIQDKINNKIGYLINANKFDLI